MTLPIIYAVMIFFALMSLFLVIHLFDHHRARKRRLKLKERIQNDLLKRYALHEDIFLKYPKRLIYENYIELAHSMKFSREDAYWAYSDFVRMGMVQKSLVELQSRSLIRRLKAITFLSTFNEIYIRNRFLELLKTEKNERAKTLLVYKFKDRLNHETLPVILDSLVGSKRFYQSRVANMLLTYLNPDMEGLGALFDRKEFEIKEVFAEYALHIIRTDFESLLKKELRRIEDALSGIRLDEYQGIQMFRIRRLYLQILDSLSRFYSMDLDKPQYMTSKDQGVLEIALLSFEIQKQQDIINNILRFVPTVLDSEKIVQALLRALGTDVSLLDDLLDIYQKQDVTRFRSVISEVLSRKTDYLCIKLVNENPELLRRILNDFVQYRHTTYLINFINSNKDETIHSFLLTEIKTLARFSESFLMDLNMYLNKDLYKKLDFYQLKLIPDKRKSSENEVKKTRWLIRILVFSIIFLPILFVLIHITSVFSQPFMTTLQQYVLFLNRGFIFYYLTINLIYFILALLSSRINKEQRLLWQLKSHEMLYEKGMIPSVSIIAPAYNEELSICESVRSLLNLDYPNYEVIVVNDGSKDKTLDVVIKEFDLKRVDVIVPNELGTQPVKAVYRNKIMPNLTVIDKQNGGKADALNVGINYSSKEYVCGIDADSLLECDALLRLMSSMLDHDKITVALGGAIVPVNGCEVDRGRIEKFGMPKSMLARFQAVEYIRAFNISRQGFSKLRSLLIISGAFGVFEKRILMDCGGYLTVKNLKKDTVGEDMELVVRITRKALEQHLNYRVDFLSEARCYTEVPESRKSFFKQRNRWQRGLVDILSYHRKMIFSPKYKHPGMTAMPYFFIFEMVGPLFEVQAYLAILGGLVFGLLNIEIILLLVIVTVLMGVFLSLFSLFLSEKERETYSLKDVMILVFFAIIENFGWRQVISLHRVAGFLASLKENQAWGQMNRVGFQAKKST